MAPNAPAPTTPPRPPTTAPSAPAPVRRPGLRTLPPRSRATTEGELDTITRNETQERTHADRQNTGGVKESAQPDMYITMISSVLGPIVRKLEALEGHIEVGSNNIETYDMKVNTLVGQITSLFTTVKTNEALARTLLVANKESEEKMDNLMARISEIGAQNSTLLEIIRQNGTQTANLETKIANLETMVGKLEAQNSTLLEAVQNSTQTQSPNVQVPPNATLTYADIARQPPGSLPRNSRAPPSLNPTPPTTIDTLYCTVDTSRVGEDDKDKAQPGAIRQAIEREVRKMEGHENWRCMAVVKDVRREYIRLTCRDEAELQHVKEAAQKISIPRARVLRDQLYPVKIDNANRTTILDHEGRIRPEAAEVLGKENDVNIAKIDWLSKKDAGKAYGSMVVYVTKGSDAVRLLQDKYFHVDGESAYTRIYEPRSGPTQCYRCQELGHKAFSCTKPQRCAKCAQEGHHHSECRAEIWKCTLCGGPHESFSKNCRVLHPPRHE
jgi:hypothetical protein